MDYIEDDAIIGVGSGSTVNFFIEALGRSRKKIKGAVPASIASEKLLKKYGIPVFGLDSIDSLPVYIDSADEATPFHHLVKGGGGALTREKVIATVSDKFVCIIDDSKIVSVLGNFPLPVEVIPMAQNYIARQFIKLGGKPVLRQNFKTDNGNSILDIHGLNIENPPLMEQQLNQIAGIVTNGLFAQRSADVLLVGNDNRVEIQAL